MPYFTRRKWWFTMVCHGIMIFWVPNLFSQWRVKRLKVGAVSVSILKSYTILYIHMCTYLIIFIGAKCFKQYIKLSIEQKTSCHRKLSRVSSFSYLSALFSGQPFFKEKHRDRGIFNALPGRRRQGMILEASWDKTGSFFERRLGGWWWFWVLWWFMVIYDCFVVIMVICNGFGIL